MTFVGGSAGTPMNLEFLCRVFGHTIQGPDPAPPLPITAEAILRDAEIHHGRTDTATRLANPAARPIMGSSRERPPGCICRQKIADGPERPPAPPPEPGTSTPLHNIPPPRRSRSAEMAIEEFPHHPIHLRIAPAVTTAHDGAERHRHARIPQRPVEQFALVGGHQRVLAPVTDQKRRVIPQDMADRIGSTPGIGVLLDGPALSP